MTVQIGLLRAVNLVAHKRVSMTDLRTMMINLGFADAQTVLQSGNVVFRTNRGSGGSLEDVLEQELDNRLGVRTEFFVRSADQLKRVIARNPLPREAERDPTHLLVMFCKKTAGRSPTIKGAGRELVRPAGKEIYVYYPDGVGRSRLKIDVLATARNWNTVLKLAAVAASFG